MGIIVQNVRGLALVLHVHLLPHLLLHFPVSVHVAYSTTPPKKTLLKRYLFLTTERICSTIGSTNTAVGPRCILPGHIHV